MGFISLAPGVMGLDSKYRFKPLPTTEGAAGALEYVCEFTGGAGANETGVGGGLTGADLVLAAVNSPGASSGGWRPIVKDTNQGFRVTTGFVNAAAQSAAGYSVLYGLKDLDPGTNAYNYICLLQSSGYLTGGISFVLNKFLSTNRRSLTVGMNTYNATDSIGTTLGNQDTLSSNPSDATFLLLASFDYATKTSFVGIIPGLVQPTKLSDCLYFAMNRGDSAFSGAVATTSFASNRDAIIGCADSTYATAGVKVGFITWAKYPCFVPV